MNKSAHQPIILSKGQSQMVFFKHAMTKKLITLLTLIVVMSTLNIANAWTGSGHRRVAMLAWARLTPEAQQMATYLLNSGDDAPSLNCKTDPFDVAASWLDCVRDKGPVQAAVMHADRTQLCKNITIPTACKSQHCATDALKQAVIDLNDKASSIQKRRIALKIIMHLVGDLHQPLHAAQAADPIHNGGTTTVLTEPNSQPIVFHQYWDYNVIQNLRFHKANLNTLIKAHASEWEKGSIDDWVHETVEEAPDTVYKAPLKEVMCDPNKMKTPVLLTKEYMDAATAFADYKIAQAGVRLALILNKAAVKGNKWLYADTPVSKPSDSEGTDPINEPTHSDDDEKLSKNVYVWNGQWRTIVPGIESVCGTNYGDISAGPIWNNADAQIKCANAVIAKNK